MMEELVNNNIDNAYFISVIELLKIMAITMPLIAIIIVGFNNKINIKTKVILCTPLLIIQLYIVIYGFSL
jgi:hypothetical protein